MLRIALAVLAASLAVAAPTFAAPVAQSPATKLAAALKTSMQRTYKTTVPGLVFRRVTCKLSANLKTAQCDARFTWAAQRRNGVYKVTASIDRTTGGVRWRATSVSCTNSQTGKKVAC
jgi:hypothetical protein